MNYDRDLPGPETPTHVLITFLDPEPTQMTYVPAALAVILRLSTTANPLRSLILFPPDRERKQGREGSGQAILLPFCSLKHGNSRIPDHRR